MSFVIGSSQNEFVGAQRHTTQNVSHTYLLVSSCTLLLFMYSSLWRVFQTVHGYLILKRVGFFYCDYGYLDVSLLPVSQWIIPSWVLLLCPNMINYKYVCFSKNCIMSCHIHTYNTFFYFFNEKRKCTESHLSTRLCFWSHLCT